MKKLIYRIAGVMLAMSLLLIACNDEEIVKQGSIQVEEGLSVSLTSLRFSTSDLNIQSRVEQSEATENQVSSLYIYVFNRDGSVDYQGAVSDENRENSQVGSLNVHTGASKKIAAIANASRSLSTQLETVDNEEKLKALTETMNAGNLNRSSFLMTCLYTVTIDENGNLYDENNENAPLTNLVLERADAKITFKINLASTITDEEEGVTATSNLSFSPTGFTVYNLPNVTSLIPQETEPEITYSSGSGEFDSSEADNKNDK